MLFLISKCSAWSANRALDQFLPLPFCGLGNLRISLANLGNHLIPVDDSSVEVCRRRWVTSFSSGNRIPQSWSDLGEIISSFSTEGPFINPEMGRWTPPLVCIRMCSKSLSVIRSPFTKALLISRKSNRGIWFSSSAISSFRGSTLGETERPSLRVTASGRPPLTSLLINCTRGALKVVLQSLWIDLRESRLRCCLIFLSLSRRRNSSSVSLDKS